MPGGAVPWVRMRVHNAEGNNSQNNVISTFLQLEEHMFLIKAIQVFIMGSLFSLKKIIQRVTDHSFPM